MPQIWWCVYIFHFLILFFGHFSKWSAGVSIHVRVAISMRFDERPTSAVWHPLLHMAPGCEVYAVFMYFFLLCIVLHRSLFDDWCGILFLTCFHDSCLMWCGIICVMYLLSWFVMLCFLDLFVVCWWDTHVSPCMFSLRSLLCHVGEMLLMHEFFVSY